MRLIYIPGFGEDPSIFDRIHPHIPGEKVFVDNWKLIGNKPRPGLNALQYAEELVDQFKIRETDVVIGHSMGGWIGLHIKFLVGCRIVQIGSWTDARKVVRKLHSRHLLYFLAKRGLIFNPLNKHAMIWQHYKNKPSREIFSSVVDNLIRRNRNNVVNQLRVIFNPVKERVRVNPDLRIHARPDKIIHFPDQEAVEVEGDHFSLYTHPNKVYEPILNLLKHKEILE